MGELGYGWWVTRYPLVICSQNQRFVKRYRATPVDLSAFSNGSMCLIIITFYRCDLPMESTLVYNPAGPMPIQKDCGHQFPWTQVGVQINVW